MTHTQDARFRTAPASMAVESVDAGTSTDVTVRETKFDLKLPGDFFTQRTLEQGPP